MYFRCSLTPDELAEALAERISNYHLSFQRRMQRLDSRLLSAVQMRQRQKHSGDEQESDEKLGQVLLQSVVLVYITGQLAEHKFGQLLSSTYIREPRQELSYSQ